MDWSRFSREWFDKLTNAILEQVLSNPKSDYSLFTGVIEGTVLIVLVYVDDILVSINELEDANSFNLHDQLKLLGFGTFEILSRPWDSWVY